MTKTQRNVLTRAIESKMSEVREEIKAMLHAHRDCLRNQGVDTTKVSFDCRDGYYGEAFGVLRTLRILGYGDFGAVNDPKTLSYLMAELEDEVLAEENFGGSNRCEYCFERWHQDGARPRK